MENELDDLFLLPFLLPLPLRDELFAVVDVVVGIVEHLLHLDGGIEAEFAELDVIDGAIVRTDMRLAIDGGAKGAYTGNVDGMAGGEPRAEGIAQLLGHHAGKGGTYTTGLHLAHGQFVERNDGLLPYAERIHYFLFLEGDGLTGDFERKLRLFNFTGKFLHDNQALVILLFFFGYSSAKI